MLRRRDPVAIGNVGDYTIKESLNIKDLQTSLTTDVNAIRNSYQGTDAEALIDNLLKEISALSGVIEVLDYSGNYMKTLAGYDTDNLNGTKQSFGSNLVPSFDQPLNQALDLPNVIEDTEEGVANGGYKN